jgi:hypothetical protein
VCTFAVNIIFWLAPDRFVAMKSIHLKLDQNKFEELLSEFKDIRKEIFPLGNLIMLNLFTEIMAIFVGIILNADKYLFVLLIGISFLVPFCYSIRSLYRTWKILDLS